MDAFVGKWEYVSSDNMEAYVKKLGADLEKMKAMEAIKYTMNVEKKGNGLKTTIQGGPKSIVIEFELDKEFDETTPDGRKVKNIFHLQGGKLIQEQKGDKNTHFERVVEGDKLIIDGTCEDVKFRRIYKKI